MFFWEKGYNSGSEHIFCMQEVHAQVLASQSRTETLVSIDNIDPDGPVAN